MHADRTVSADDFRIQEVRTVTLYGAKRLAFKAFERKGDAFVHVGQFTAPVRTAKRDLWRIAAART